MILDVNGRITYCNPYLLSVTGYSLNEMTGADWFKMMIPDTDIKTKELFLKGLKNGNIPEHFENPILTKERKLREIHWNSTILKNDSGSIVGTASIGEDITKHKHFEDSLRESEEKYRYLFANNPQPMWIYDLETLSFLEVNDAAINNYGYTREEFLSMTLKDIRPAEDVEALLKDVELTRKTYNPAGEWRHLKKNGELMIVEIISHTITFNNRKARHVMVNDITERKLAEQNLQESQKLFSNAFQVGPVGMTITRISDGRFMNANESFCKMFEFDRNDVIGHTSTELNMWSLEERQRLIQQQIATGGLHDFEIVGRSKSGKLIDLLFSSKQMELRGEACHITTMIDITERKQAQEALREREYLLSASQRAAHIGTWSWKVGDTMVYWSDETFRIYGLNPDMGQPSFEFFFEIIHQDDRLKMQEWPTAIIAGLHPAPIEFRVLRPDGIYRVIQTDGDVIETVDGVPSRIAGTAHDITERKQTEEKIRENISLIRIATEKAKLGGWNVDLKENRSFWSDEVAAIHEMPPGYAPLVEDGINFYAPEWRDRIIKVFTDCAGNGVPYDEEMEIITSTGKRVWVRTIGEAVRDENGQIFKVQGAFQDISEKKLVEAKVREKDLQFRKLSANVPDLIFQFTRKPDGSYFVPIASEGIRNIFGCSPEDVMDDFTPIGRVIYPDDAVRVISDIEYSAEHLTHFICEFRVQIPGREIQWIFSRSTPEKLPDGSITWYGFNADITERKLAEEEINKLNVELEQRVKDRTLMLEAANKELEAFSYSVSHDLRSPLRHINGFAEILTKQYTKDLPEDAIKHLNTIIASAKKMGALIDDLLSFSRTSRIVFKKTIVSMNQVVDEVLYQCRPSVTERKVVWEVTALPEVEGDYNLLRIVWVNLIDNALKYTSLRKKAVIKIGYMDEKSETVFFIQDNGVGFDMKYADKLFGVFQRLHLSSQFDGTGIGLANVQRIILRHGGRAWAEAEIDKGATFYFSIPKEAIGIRE